MSSLSLHCPPHQPFLYVLQNPNLKKQQKKRPLLRGWKHLLSVVAMKVLTSSINLFVHFLNLGYCDSASRVLTPLNPLSRNDTTTCRRPMKPEFLPMKLEKRKKNRIHIDVPVFSYNLCHFALLKG